MTQAEVAQQVGVTPTSYAQWERGEATPRLTHLRKLARVLKVSPAALLAEFPNGGEGKGLVAAAAKPHATSLGLPGVVAHVPAAVV